MTLKSPDFSCDHFVAYSIENKFEWDENKNISNQEKHGIGFERAKDLLKDELMLQMVEQVDKWEDLSNLPDHVERNQGNTDPIRGKYIGVIDNKIYTAIYTFRGAVGEMRARIISLRRADKHEVSAYEEFRKHKTDKKGA